MGGWSCTRAIIRLDELYPHSPCGSVASLNLTLSTKARTIRNDQRLALMYALHRSKVSGGDAELDTLG